MEIKLLWVVDGSLSYDYNFRQKSLECFATNRISVSHSTHTQEFCLRIMLDTPRSHKTMLLHGKVSMRAKNDTD